MLALLVILPLVIAAFLAIAMKGHPKVIKYVALIASLLSLIIVVLLYMYSSNQIQSINWFSFSGYPFQIMTSTMALNMLLLSLVAIITPLVITYSIGFMDLPSEQPRYYFELCMFAAAMMLFSISANFITMFVGWELLGVTSYLLIGFWYRRDGTAAAARKAITIILIGDMLMLFGILLIWNTYHTFSFSTILQQSALQSSSMKLALTLIIFAAFTKSAQFPFHEWLPDAMKGPTPVSAFLHSSTMVKAGVFLIAVLLPLFIAYHLLPLLLVFGIITAVIGVTNALAETQIKRVLAYSTLEDLGLMFVALGTGSLIAAIALLLVQTFYKALLFMYAGSIIKANNNEEEIGKVYNSPSYNQIFIPALIGVASLAGLFPLSGFFGKAAVVASTNNILVYGILLAIGLFSTVYIFRWLLIPLRKKPYGTEAEASANYKTLPKSMTIPIQILAALVIAASFMFYPGYHIGTIQLSTQIKEIATSIIIFVAGTVIAYFLFYKKGYTNISKHRLSAQAPAQQRANKHDVPLCRNFV